MEDFNTVDDLPKGIDPLLVKQREEVANMRTSLLLCSDKDASVVSTALNNITISRIYHQLARIIRFTEIMDNIEDKLYESINNYLDTADTFDDNTWQTLMAVQKQLQTTLIESHKLLEPYLELPGLNADSLTAINNTVDGEVVDTGLDKDTRNHVRDAARRILAELDDGGDPNG